jgi:spore coat protein U-like protein
MHALMPRLPRWLPALVLAGALVAAVPPGLGARGQKGCALDGATFMAFGNYDPMRNSPLDLQGRVSYRCYNEKSVAGVDDPAADSDNGKLIVQISLSTGGSGSFNRYMNGTGDRLSYNLFLDPQRQTVWGDGTGGTQYYTEHAQPNNHVVTVPVYGRVFGAQDVGAGSYVDQLIVTLDF